MVTIPQGNYDNQKIIIGKQVTKDNTPLAYKSPMENMVNLTNNLIPDNSNLKVEMWANSNDYAWNEGSKLSESEVYTAVKDGKLKYCIWDSIDCNTEFFYQKYDVLGLSAQFSTWLNEYNTITGNYGLILEVTFKDLNTQENFAKIYSCQFDSSEFFGDIYNFETYYTQEKVFDLSDYKDSAIVRLRLFPYQRRNFTTVEGEDVPYLNEDDFSNIPPNIYMKDFMISLGTYSNEITEDTAEIMTDSSMTYDKDVQNDLVEYDLVWVTNYLLDHKELLPVEAELITDNLKHLLRLYNSGVIAKIKYEREFESLLTTYGYEDIENNFISPIMHKKNREINNLKYINLRWIHIFENQVKVVEEDEIPEDYEIRWYRYKPGAPSPDQFSGAHWEYLAAAGEESSTLNKITVEFQPDVNNNEEKIKVIIIKKEKDIQDNLKEYKIAISNVLEFTNNTQVRDSITFEDISALTLRVDGNFHGNYLLYDRSGKLGKNEWDTEYSITALFKDQPLAVEDCSLIEWTIPTENTMIKSYKPIGEKDSTIYYYIKNYLDNKAINNTISLKIIKDGLEYAAAATLRFGTAGTNGSNYTMALIWDDNKKAINVQPDEFNEGDKLSTDDQDKYALKGTLYVYDQSGSPVDLSSAKIELSWATAADCNLLKNNSADGTNNYIFEDEEEDIYYPVFITNDQNSLQPLTSFVSGFSPRQPDPTNKDFYYFKQSNFNSQLHTYKKFNLENKTFEDFTPTSGVSYGAVYRKRYETDLKKKKIEFKQVSVVNSSKEVVSGKTVLYNSQRRYFIKYNGQYILDPWDKYQSSETYYEPILVAPRIDDSNQSGSSQLIANIDGQRVTISYETPFNNLNYIYILKITLNNFGDYPLIMYKPIALTSTKGTNLMVNYINGPEDVRYATTGETDFNKNPYEIEVTYIDETDSEIIKYYYNEELSQDQTRILNSNYAPDGETPDPKPTGTGGTPEHEHLRGYWRLIIAENYDKWNPAEENNQFYPSLKETALGWFKQPSDNATYNVQTIKKGKKRKFQDRYWLTYRKPILKPPAVYYKDAAPYAVQFLKLGGTVLWTQPIFVYQDNYPSTTLNQWNGKDIITDNDTGTIVANGFAAGHKNSDNTFSGVVLGDWSRTDTDRSFAVNETGVYGFNHGAMSYALKDDGTAFFGKDGRGRIYIDGNNATIKSASWRYDKPEGMMIDLDDGILDTRSQNSQVYISPNKDNLLNVQVTINGENGKEKKDILHVGDSSYYLRTANYKKESQTTPGTGTQIDLNAGTITSYNFELNTIKTYDENLGLKKGISLNSSIPEILVRYDQEGKTPFYLMRLNAKENYFYLQSPNYDTTNRTGTRINLRDGIISSYGFKLDAIQSQNNEQAKDALQGIFLSSAGPKFQIRSDTITGKTATPQYLINIDNASNVFYLASKDYNTTNHTGTQINLADGKITSYNLDLQAFGTVGSYNGNSYDHTGKLLRLNSGAAYYPLKIGTQDDEEFKVTWGGKLIATGAQISGKINATQGGNIAGWQINEDNLYKTCKTESGEEYEIKISSETKDLGGHEGMGNIFEVKYKENANASSTYPFAVKANGALIATSGQIAGWTIDKDSLLKTSESRDADGNLIATYDIKISSKTTNDKNQEGMGNIFEVKVKEGNNSSTYPFAVKANGTLIANSGRIGSWNISTGAAQSLYKTRTTDDSNDNNVGTIYLGGATYGIYVNNGRFSVDYSGNMIANSGTFKGKLEGATGNFSGKITANSGTIGGWTINSPDTDNGSLTKVREYSQTNSGRVYLGGNQYAIWVNDKFKVDYSGNMTATSGKFTGTITSSTITGSSITAGNGNFVANSSGVSVKGSITATAYYMGNYTSSFSPQSLDVITSIGMLPDGTIKYINGATISFISLTTAAAKSVYTRSSGCFIAGTKISMADGTYKNIEDVQKNNLILSYDENKSNYVIGKVLRTKKNNISTKIVKILLSNNIEINMTLSHPILTTAGWKALDCNAAFIEHGIVCELLSKNDQIITQNGIFSIKNMVEYNYNLPVYNLTIDKYHTYIANTCIVHNTIVVAETK